MSSERTARSPLWAWVAIALLFFATGRKSMRRAALRGLISLGIAKAASSVPQTRALLGDEAASAAFVMGASLQVPMASPALAAVAAVLHETARGDVPRQLAAVSAGAAIAAGTTRVWPVPPPRGPTAPKVFLPEYADPNEDGEGLVIVVNESSGGNGDGPAKELARALPRADIREVSGDDGDELRKELDGALAAGAIALGICGGDGSVNAAAQIALDAQKALVVIPGGTFDHLAEALGIETVADAVSAVKKGEAVGIDVATIAGRVFLNTASFGSYVELVDARERLEDKIGKWPAVIVALIRVLRSGETVEVEIDGKQQRVWMAFIGNCRYHPSGFAPTWRERLDDEMLDVRYVTGDAPWARTRLILAVITGRLGRSKIYHQKCVERLELRSLQGPIRLARDGETFEGPEEIVVEKLPKRLAVFVPHSKRP